MSPDLPLHCRWLFIAEAVIIAALNHISGSGPLPRRRPCGIRNLRCRRNRYSLQRQNQSRRRRNLRVFYRLISHYRHRRPPLLGLGFPVARTQANSIGRRGELLGGAVDRRCLCFGFFVPTSEGIRWHTVPRDLPPRLIISRIYSAGTCLCACSMFRCQDYSSGMCLRACLRLFHDY